METTPKLTKIELQYCNHEEIMESGFDISDCPVGESWVLLFKFDNGAGVRMGVKDIRQSQEFSIAAVNAALEITRK